MQMAEECAVSNARASAWRVLFQPREQQLFQHLAVCLLRCPKLGAAFGCGWIESTGYLMQQRQVRLGVSDGLSVVLVLLPTCRGKLGLSAGVQLQYGRRG
jgi:hypothetical protein